MTKKSAIDQLAAVTQEASVWLLRFGAVGLLLMTAIVGWQVFGRFVLNSSPSWSEQSALMLMIWFTSFGAAAGVREGFHIRIVALENATSGKMRLILRLVSEATVLVCGIAMTIGGLLLVQKTWSHIIPSLGLPRGVAYLGLPIAGFLIVLFAAERILEVLTAHSLDDEEDPRWS